MNKIWNGNIMKCGDLRSIQHKNQDPECCHHLKLVLEVIPPGCTMIMGIAVSVMSMLPKELILALRLSIEKENKKGYYCTQCGRRFTPGEFELYHNMFQKAQICRFDAWNLKPLFAQRNQETEEQLMEKIIPGNQKYSCPVSRMIGGDIMLREDEDALYDELIERFH